MLGLSLQKIAVFIAILGALWTGYRLFRRWEQSQQPLVGTPVAPFSNPLTAPITGEANRSCFGSTSIRVDVKSCRPYASSTVNST